MNAVRSPTAIVPPMTCCPPNQITARIVKFITSIIAGIIMITTLSARMVVLFRSPFAWANRSFSKSSRTNDLMTRTFVRSSWILLFRPSIFACIRVNRGKPVRTTVTMITASSGIETASTTASEGFMAMVMISAPISMPGARRHMRISMLIMFMIWVTSLVRRVTSEPVEKWSMFANENF